MPKVADRLFRIEDARRQRGTRIVRQAGEEGVHPLDLGVLVIHDLACEFVHDRIGSRAALAVQFLHHGDSALMVTHHQLQEITIEVRATRGGQSFQLIGRRHACHARMRGVTHARHRHRLATVRQPAAHEGDFIFLRSVDTACHGKNFRRIGPVRCQCRHLDGLLVVDNHALHESDICR